MLVSYLITGLRNLRKNRGIHFFNILGLGFALSCCILEYSYDRFYSTMDNFHEKGDRIFLVTTLATREGTERLWGDSPAPLASEIVKTVVQVKASSRYQSMGGEVILENMNFNENFIFVDAKFLSMFNFPLLSGNPDSLEEGNGVILSKETAIKFFGTTECTGKIFESLIPTKSDSLIRLSFIVKGVADEFPKNSSFSFTILVPFDILDRVGFIQNDWRQEVNATFLEMEHAEDIHSVERLSSIWANQHNQFNPDWPVLDFKFEPLETLSANSHLIMNDIARGTAPEAKVVMFVLASFILLLAIFNFVNISMSNASRRLKEIGFRKATGAFRSQLITQFMVETSVISFLGLVVGIAMAYFFILPGFSAITPVKLSMSLHDPWLPLFLISIWIVTTLGGGAFPAFYISKFHPVEILRGTQKLGAQGIFNRLVLGFQFFLACMTVANGVVFIRNNIYQHNLDWGYNQKNVIVLPLEKSEDFITLRERLKSEHEFTMVAGSKNVIGKSFKKVPLESEGEKTEASHFGVGFDYLNTLGIRLIRGRMFDEHISSDTLDKIIVNQQLVKSLHLTDPFNSPIRIDSRSYRIIGIVEDFNYQSFSRVILPALFTVVPENRYEYLSVRSSDGDDELLSHVEQIWKTSMPDQLFQGFYQETVSATYFEMVDSHTKIILFSTLIAVFLACVGLYGITSLRLTSKVKELGIRKLLGATGFHLSYILNKEIMILLLISFCTAIPLSYIFLEKLLSSVYKLPVPLSPLAFVPVIFLMLVFVSLTIGSLIYKALKTNPATQLRS